MRRTVLDSEGNLVACHAAACAPIRPTSSYWRCSAATSFPTVRSKPFGPSLERRRKAHKPGDLEHQRERLEAVLLRLGQLFDWGELSESEYRGKVADIRRQLAALPSPDDKLVLFDRFHSEVRSFAETLIGASEEKVLELVALAYRARRDGGASGRPCGLVRAGAAVLPGRSRKRPGPGVVGRGAPGRTRGLDATRRIFARLVRGGEVTASRQVRLAALALCLGLGLAGLHASDPSPVSALSCGTGNRNFAGNTESHSDAVRGAKAAIEYFNPALCATSGTGTFSSYWVGVVGPYVNGRNIFQVGIDKCKSDQCVNGAPSNQTYKFWAYGREAGSCGLAEDPAPHPIGNISSGTLTYKILREYLYGQAYYNLYISTSAVLAWTYTEQALETCWGSVDGAQYLNEALYDGTQVGGQSGNTQTYQSVYWHNGSRWLQVTGTTGAWCDYHEGPGTGCKWHSTDNTLWNVWDTRY